MALYLKELTLNQENPDANSDSIPYIVNVATIFSEQGYFQTDNGNHSATRSMF